MEKYFHTTYNVFLKINFKLYNLRFFHFVYFNLILFQTSDSV